MARNSFRFAPEWKESSGRQSPQIDSRLDGGEVDGEIFRPHSLSGLERNHLFLNREGETFDDLSALSGLDTLADSRGSVFFDYNHDGHLDVALVNANKPLFNLYRNDIPKIGTPNQFLAIRFVGGNNTSQPSGEYACRDGYGAKVFLDLLDRTLIREHRCGEGYATQNSSTMIVGIGRHTEVREVKVEWPSGKTMTVADVKAGLLLIADERSHQFESRPYKKVDHIVRDRRQLTKFPMAPPTTEKIHVFTTMATWCPSCKKHLPAQRALSEALPVGLHAIPIDPEDDIEKLAKYREKWKPSYRLMSALTTPERESLAKFVAKQMHAASSPLPSSIVTDGEGQILHVTPGVPSVSLLRKLLDSLPSS